MKQERPLHVAIYTHPDCLEHDPGPGHPENRARLDAVLTALRLSSFSDRLAWEDAPPASDDQLHLAHAADYVASIRSSSPASGYRSLDADTIMSPASLSAALHGSGAVCSAVDAVVGDDYRAGFCAVRPPGHHATRNRAMGFCLFNHIAVGARYAQTRGLDRVAIVDFDVHHGNGTQDIVQGREGVLYISTHQSPHYPGTGSERENVEGNILNVPLPAGIADEAYREVFSERVMPAIDAFGPDLILASAGFDAHRLDPLAGLALTEDTYHWIGARLAQAARQHCNQRLVSTLEGGYDTNALGRSVVAYLAGMVHAGSDARGEPA